MPEVDFYLTRTRIWEKSKVYERAGSVTQREFFFTVNAADSFEQRYPSLGLTTDFVR